MSNTRAAAREKQHSVRKVLLLGCMVALFGAACGQRGPLYLPEQAPAATPAAPAAAEDAQNEAGEAEKDSAEEKDAEEKDDE